MVSKVCKGSYFERIIREGYKKEGFIVDYKSKTSGIYSFTKKQFNHKLKHNKDFFNLWDIMAISNKRLEFIQVKSTIQGVSDFKQKSKSFILECGTRACFVIILCLGQGKFRGWYWNGILKEWIEYNNEKESKYLKIKEIINPIYNETKNQAIHLRN